MTDMSISISRGTYGQWCISAIVRGHLFARQYYGHTKVFAIALFRAEAQKEERA
jgi:hypothetical protein